MTRTLIFTQFVNQVGITESVAICMTINRTFSHSSAFYRVGRIGYLHIRLSVRLTFSLFD